MRSPASANEVLRILRDTGLDAPILRQEDPRWQRLRFVVGQGVDLRDRLRGALVGGAIGDAMARANEGASASDAGARRIREYQSWAGWQDGPKGTSTDDTQMTMWLAESILDAAQRAMETGVADPRDHIIDPDDLARRFTREHIRGIG